MRDDATYVVDTITALRAEVEQFAAVREEWMRDAALMRAEIERLQNTDRINLAVIRNQQAEIERLTAERANRYWEGRYRDEARENERLTTENHQLMEDK